METNHISVDRIRVDGGTQMRAAINEETVKEYTERYLAGERMPALVVFYDGSTYWLADGFHRHRALVDSATPQALCEIRGGNRRAAVLYACGANASHGLRRTNADKRRSIEAMLRDEEWVQWTDRRIAQVCGVDHKTVAAVRDELTGELPQSAPVERIGSDGRTTNTANIGKRPTSDKPATPRAVDPEDLPVAVDPARASIMRDAMPASHKGPAPMAKRNTPTTDPASPVSAHIMTISRALIEFMDRTTMALGEQSHHLKGCSLSEDEIGMHRVAISQLVSALSEHEANLGAEQ